MNILKDYIKVSNELKEQKKVCKETRKKLKDLENSLHDYMDQHKINSMSHDGYTLNLVEYVKEIKAKPTEILQNLTELLPDHAAAIEDIFNESEPVSKTVLKLEK